MVLDMKLEHITQASNMFFGEAAILRNFTVNGLTGAGSFMKVIASVNVENFQYLNSTVRFFEGTGNLVRIENATFSNITGDVVQLTNGGNIVVKNVDLILY